MSVVEPIAIIGIGCRLPGGVRGPDDLWNVLAGGIEAIGEVPKDRWNAAATYHPDPSKPGRSYTRRGGFLDQIDRFDAQFFGITPREASAADPQQRLLLEVAYEAIEDAGLTLSSLAGKRAGVHVGISAFDYAAVQFFSRERATIDAYTNVGMALSIVANRLSYFFNLIGPSFVVDTACSSSLVATHLGCQSIWNGESELEFIAGVNVMLTPELGIGFSKASMLAPDGRCKAFDVRADGFVRSEGIAVAILKPLSRALADHDHIYAVIRATAVNQDGRTEGITVPNRVSQQANIVDALQLAEIAANTIQYVEAHGTGTPVGDPIEAAAIGAVYGIAQKPQERCVIGSIKGNLGHLESTSGIAGLIKAALCLKHRQIPANLNFEQPNPQIPFDDLQLRVPQRLESWPETYGQPPRAGVNSFGFGGTNAHAILEAPPEPDLAACAHTAVLERAEVDDGRPWMLPISARSAPALSDLARLYLNSLKDEQSLKNAGLRDICFTATAKRSHHEFRLALVGHDKAELVEQIEAFLKGETRANSSSGRASDEPVRPVFICSGMGQQWWGMGRELLAQEPVYRQAVEQVCDRFADLCGFSLLNEIMADEMASHIQETHIGQPAIFALQVGLAALWRSWGIEPAAVFGHSAGELAASHISGALSLEDAVLAAYHRSRLQRRLAGQGAMLAAGISRAEASRLVERHPRAISIAAINGPGSVTLSGDARVLAEIDKTLNEAGLFSRALQVEVPFHSPKMEQLRADILEVLHHIRPRPASTPFFSTVTGTALAGSELDAKYWYRNIREPVLFSDTMGELIKTGHRVFLELGAHPILRYDIGECLKEKSVQGTALCSLRRQESERAALLGSHGRMYTLGAEIDWRKLFPTGTPTVKLPRYPFQREGYWREPEQARRVRVGEFDHPLLGHRREAPQPLWNVHLDTADLDYLVDHRIGNAIVFPGAGYVEMALAAAREIFGSIPCVVEDIEFQKFLVLDEKTARPVQLVIDPASSDFGVYARADDAETGWDLHARGYIRQPSQSAPSAVDLAEIRRRCVDSIDRGEYFRRFSEIGINYGPSFQGIYNIWRGEREALAEIRALNGLGESSANYRIHPAVLDACLQSTFAAVPTNGATHETFVPAKIERIRFHSGAPNRLFAHAYVKEFGPTEVKADIQVLDESGNRLIDVTGFVCRPTGHSLQPLRSTIYEYQWKLKLRTTGGARDSQHLPDMQMLSPLMQDEGESLRQRFNAVRLQNEFRILSRATTAAYIVGAWRELGWTPDLASTPSIDALADRLGMQPRYRGWLRLMLKELTEEEKASAQEPQGLWRGLWDQFPDCQAEVTLLRLCGENLAAVLRGEIDPLTLLFPQGTPTNLEHVYQDSPTLRINNLLLQKAVAEIVRRLPQGKALRILEVGGGTGGTTSFILPVLPDHCSKYVFTDVTPTLVAQAQRKYARYSFVQYQTLDIERDPLEQGFDTHSFDLVIACDVLHATKDLRGTIKRVKQLLGSGGTLVLLETTRPWLIGTLIFGLLEGWWLFEDHDLRPYQPCVSPGTWKSLLSEAGFGAPVCIADCPDAGLAQHSVILASGPQLPAVPKSPVSGERSSWLLFVDQGVAGRPSAGAQLAGELRQRGDRVIEVMYGVELHQDDGSRFTVRAGNLDDMRSLMESIRTDLPRLSGVVHLWSLDTETIEPMTHDNVVSSARLGCIGAMQLVQALAATDNLAADSLWLITRAAQPVDSRMGAPEVMQSPLWGLGRVAITEYPNLHVRLVDLTTCSHEEIISLAEQLTAGGDETEDEIALHGELRYVRRLVPVSLTTMHGMGRQIGTASHPFRIELRRPGALDSLMPCVIQRRPPKTDEIEIEVAATGLNFRDLMLSMGLYPREAVASDPGGTLVGLECAGRVSGVGEGVSEFVVGDEVVAFSFGTFASHITVESRLAARKPTHLSLEQAATIPGCFVTAFYSLHTLGQLQHGERVLIHSGASGVGLAAVQLALKAGAEVFATAGSPEKRDLLAVLGVPHVMDSHSLAFADEVLELTGGEGVDLVLNSLAGEAIDKNLSILRSCGRFVEIGKADIYNNRKLGMGPLRKNISLFAVDMIGVLVNRPEVTRSLLRELIEKIERNELRALPQRVFPVTRVVDAFRTMAQAKHVGKLVVSIKDTAGLRIEEPAQQVAIDPDASYLITGGLGGLGLAVADRLARRGARHLALLGRSGPSPSAQAAVESLRQRGVEVLICQADIADSDQAHRAIDMVRRTMGPLRGIVHGAMVLDDAPIERLTEERMWKAMAPKMTGAWNLHVLTADVPLDFFVMFSSFASIVGTPGQANYAAGNAFLDALAYYRRARGLPALTVNWSVVGEVGYVAKTQEVAQRLDRPGITPMTVADTLDALDALISSRAVQVGVAQLNWKEVLQLLSSRTPARFAGLATETGTQGGGSMTNSRAREILEADEAAVPSLLEAYICEVLARAMQTSPAQIDTEQSLLNLGLDSLISVEVRNRIDDDFGIKIPLSKFKQGASVKTFAAHVAEILLAATRGKGPKSTNGGGMAATSEISQIAEEPTDLLERIDEMSDEEVDLRLSVLTAQGHE
jgi:acyl transferase domain-containing protein/NADPH:quinone reductase-like Zn-dependent oxidoreductase/short-subunit dehydrogenase/acyl carrier protein